MCYVKTAESDLLFLYAGLIYYSIVAEKKKARAFLWLQLKSY